MPSGPVSSVAIPARHPRPDLTHTFGDTYPAAPDPLSGRCGATARVYAAYRHSAPTLSLPQGLIFDPASVGASFPVLLEAVTAGRPVPAPDRGPGRLGGGG